MQWVMNYVVLHWFLGLCFGLVCSFVFFRNKRYRPFRFGGEDPLTWGARRRWMLWYGLAFIFEKITSLWFGNQIYVELAMSAIEAGGMTVGLFVADRIAMMFEPEALWVPDKNAYMPIDPAKQLPKEPSVQDQETWIKEHLQITSAQVTKKVDDLKISASATVAGVGEKTKEKITGVRGWFCGIFEARRAKKEMDNKAREDERKRRVEKFRDLTKNY